MNTIIHHVQCDAIGQTLLVDFKTSLYKSCLTCYTYYTKLFFFSQGALVLNPNIPTKLALQKLR